MESKLTLKDFLEEKNVVHKKKKISKKKKSSTQSKKKRKTKTKKSLYKHGGLANAWYTTGMSGTDSHSGDGGIGEGLILELLAGIMPGSFSPNVLASAQHSKNSNDKDAGMTTYPSENHGANPDAAEEEVEMKAAKVDQARQLFQALFNRPNATRADIINSFMKDVGVTNSTAVSYYTRFLDEFGLNTKDGEEKLGQGSDMGGMGDATPQHSGEEDLSGMEDDEPELEDPIHPNRAGIIRTVDNAHLVYKRQSETGTYEELWIYNVHDNTHDELDIRRDILAATDIPTKKTKSPDGEQSYSIVTMGNAQLLKITGLPN